MADAYAQVDPILHAWAGANGLKLFKSFAGRSARFCYWTSARGECFQISVEPPQAAVVRVDAWTIETLDDRELHAEWREPIDTLTNALDLAFSEVRNWAAA